MPELTNAELDRWAAETVMGWTWSARARFSYSPSKYERQCFEVVAKMRERGYLLRYKERSCGAHEADFYRPEPLPLTGTSTGYHDPLSATADTAPRAILLAAKKALEEAER
jgi:hypothetical protein